MKIEKFLVVAFGIAALSLGLNGKAFADKPWGMDCNGNGASYDSDGNLASCDCDGGMTSGPDSNGNWDANWNCGDSQSTSAVPTDVPADVAVVVADPIDPMHFVLVNGMRYSLDDGPTVGQCVNAMYISCLQNGHYARWTCERWAEFTCAPRVNPRPMPKLPPVS